MKTHWENVYQSKAPDDVSWYQRDPGISLKLINHTGLPRDAAVIDVGGGASSLADKLLDLGCTDLTVLDISSAALEHARDRLGEAARRVNWIEADITEFKSEQEFSLWHDRALFHFMTDAGDRSRYIAALNANVAPDGHVIIASFGPDGPKKCTGLDVVRYDAEKLMGEVGPGFELVEQTSEAHVTPWGAKQRFAWFRLKRVKSGK